MPSAKITSDPIGTAIESYFSGKTESAIQVISNIAEDDLIPVSYLFRNHDAMPELEQVALQVCQGNVLDIGAGAGSHALYLQEKGFAVTALEISEKATSVMKDRGLKNVIAQDFWHFTPSEPYDTVLLLMNGIGLAGTVERLPEFLLKVKSWLAPGGQILLESADILYMYEDEDGSVSLDLNGAYYGEVEYQMIFENEKSEPFAWLFVDYLLLEENAERCGLQIECLYEGENGEFLARLF